MKHDPNTTTPPEDPRALAKGWLLHLTSGDATVDDLEALRRWREASPRNDEALALAYRLWSALPAVREQLGGELGERLRAARARRAMTRRVWLGGTLAATAAGAGLLVVRPPLSLWPSLGERMADLRTRVGERRSVALSPSLTVEMNTRTTVNLRPQGEGEDVLELVSGEVFVASQEGGSRRAVVLAARGRCATADGQLTVRRDGQRVRVTCVAGEVEVSGGGRAVALSAGQRVGYAEGGLGEIARTDAATATAWRRGELVFYEEPLSAVIDEVNRYRPGHIVIASRRLGERRVTGRFRTDRLEDVVTQVRVTFGAKVRTLPAGVIVLT